MPIVLPLPGDVNGFKDGLTQPAARWSAVPLPVITMGPLSQAVQRRWDLTAGHGYTPAGTETADPAHHLTGTPLLPRSEQDDRCAITRREAQTRSHSDSARSLMLPSGYHAAS